MRSSPSIEEAVETCPLGICDGSGEINDMQYDHDSHQWYNDGSTKPCPHTL